MPSRAELEKDLLRARTLAVLMDARFQVFGFKFGLDPVLGLIPGIGDTVSALVGLYLLHLARKHGVGRGVILVMVLNLLLDWVCGLIPAVGDVADVALKAHLRNLLLLERSVAHLRTPPTPDGRT